MKPRVVVTGADGFIGSNLINSPIFEDCELFPLTIYDVDLTASAIVLDQKPDWVIHLAGFTSVPQSWSNPYDCYRVNFISAANVLDYCRQNTCGITLLSSYVYGTPEQELIDEDHPLKPNSPYNHSKVLVESLGNYYHKFFNNNVVILRPFNIYGPNQAKNFLIPTIFGQLLDPDLSYIELQDLSPQRDYLYIDDLLSAIRGTLGLGGYNVFNIGSGSMHSVMEVASLIMKVTGKRKPIRATDQLRLNEVTGMRADIGNINRAIEWNPKINLEMGLRLIYEKLPVEND